MLWTDTKRASTKLLVFRIGIVFVFDQFDRIRIVPDVVLELEIVELMKEQIAK